MCNWQKAKEYQLPLFVPSLYSPEEFPHTGHPLGLLMGNWPRMRQSITYWYLLLLLSPAGCNKLRTRTRSDITICIAQMPGLQTLSSSELHNCKTGEIVQFFRDLETLCKNENGHVIYAVFSIYWGGWTFQVLDVSIEKGVGYWIIIVLKKSKFITLYITWERWTLLLHCSNPC